MQERTASLLVRRHGWQLILEGRSPIEHIEVPAFIPKQEERHFRDSILAFNSGKTLAALFYLRTFIEQFARRQTGTTGRATGDELMEAYNRMLPPETRDQIPSLKEWYERLSAPIHSAEEPHDLFEQARAEIERHFDFRRLFRIAPFEAVLTAHGGLLPMATMLEKLGFQRLVEETLMVKGAARVM